MGHDPIALTRAAPASLFVRMEPCASGHPCSRCFRKFDLTLLPIERLAIAAAMETSSETRRAAIWDTAFSVFVRAKTSAWPPRSTAGGDMDSARQAEVKRFGLSQMLITEDAQARASSAILHPGPSERGIEIVTAI